MAFANNCAHSETVQHGCHPLSGRFGEKIRGGMEFSARTKNTEHTATLLHTKCQSARKSARVAMTTGVSINVHLDGAVSSQHILAGNFAAAACICCLIFCFS